MENQEPLKILFVEDLPTDMELAEYHLRTSGLSFISQRVEDHDSLTKALDDFQPDLVITDYAMPNFDGMRALHVCQEKNSNLPVIILTGSMNEQTAVTCLKAGATDYVIKEHMMMLPFAVHDAIEQKNARHVQKEAEQALIRSETNLRSLLNNSDDWIWSIDKQYRLLTGNSIFLLRMETMFGIKLEIGASVFPPALPERYSNEWKGYWNRVFRGERYLVEITPDRARPDQMIEYHFSPLISGQGEIIGGVATGHDISKRKKTEKKLKEQDEELSAIFENSPIMMIVVDQDRKIQKINSIDLGPGTTIHLNNIGQRLGEALRCVNSMDSSEGCGFGENCLLCEVSKLVRETLATGESRYQVDVTLMVGTRNDPKEINLLLSTTKLHIRNQPMVLISMLDVSEKKKADKLLIRERTLLRTLIDNLPDRIFFKDRESRFIIANEGVAKHIGVASTDDLIGKSDFDFYPREHATIYFHDEQELLRSTNPLINHEEPARDAGGTIGWTLTSKIPVTDAKGDVIGMVGISRDITELKRTNEELLKAKNLAEQSNQLKDAFIANMSHEIRTPLNSILGFSDLVRESFADYRSDETDNFFDIIDQSSQRLMRTVDMILSMSRFQVGEITINPQSINLDNTIANLVQEYSLAAKKKSLEIEYHSNCSNCVIISDDYCVSHSISNLIDNAIKYTKTGYVQVKLSKTPDGQFRFEVKDTGIGISDEYKASLFNPFSQEEPGISRPFEGIGLGLSLTKRFLDNIGAEIQVESQRGKGSTFIIIFPEAIPPKVASVSQR